MAQVQTPANRGLLTIELHPETRSQLDWLAETDAADDLPGTQKSLARTIRTLIRVEYERRQRRPKKS